MKRALALLCMVALMTGCLGRSAVGGKVRSFNLSVAENSAVREGLFLGMQVLWVYRIALLLDLFIFNSIEFWTGENWVNGKSRLVDIPVSAAEQIGFQDVDKAEVELVSDSEAKLLLQFANGDRMSFDVLRDHDQYTVSYLGRTFYTGAIDLAEDAR